MATVGTVIIDVKADTAKLVSGMDKAENSIKKTVGGIKTAILSMATAYVGIQGVRAFKNMISDSLDTADATGKLAQNLGLTTDKLSQYEYAAGFAAISTDELNAGISAMIRRVNNFKRDGGGAAKKALHELGISAEYAKEHFKTTDEAFKEILKRLEKMPDGFKKTAIAQDIFSKSASGIMRLTYTDLQKFGEESKKIGISISQSTYNMAASYHDEMDQIDARLKGFKQTVAFSVVAPLNAASETTLEIVDNMFGSNSKEQMKNFENIAVASIANVVYSIGFIKDAFTGVELVIDGLKLGFYALAGVAATAMEPVRVMINKMIESYNYLADKLDMDKIGFKLESSLPDIADKIQSITNEMGNLSKSLTDGRTTADEYVKKFKKNLVTVKEEAKKVKKEINSSVDTGESDKNSNIKKLQDELNVKAKAYSDYIQIVGTEEEKFQDKVNNQMEALSESGALTSKELMKAYTKIENDHLKSLSKTSKSTSDNIQYVFTNAFKSMEDSIVEFAKTGKLNFKDLTNSILSDMLRMEIQSTITKPLMGAISGMNLASMFGFAKGDTFLNNPSLSTHRNTVVDTPTPFFFANGGVPNLGVFGEAGSEAIMPLTRTSDGDLGVKAVANKKQDITIQIKNESGQSMKVADSSVQQDVSGMIINVVIDAVHTNKGGLRTALTGGR